MTPLLVLLAAVAPAAVAQSDAPPPVAPITKSAGTTDPNKKVCRNVKNIGSHIPVRTCYTQAQWIEVDKFRGVQDRMMEQRRPGQ